MKKKKTIRKIKLEKNKIEKKNGNKILKNHCIPKLPLRKLTTKTKIKKKKEKVDAN